jgi:hypothetical protein
MCRRWGGGLGVAEIEAAVTLLQADALRWHRSSEWGERGFCGECGSSLFWRQPGAEGGEWGVFVGALQSQDGLKIARHIFIDDKPDFYALADDAPRITGAAWVAKVLGDLSAKFGKEFLADALKKMRAHGGDAFADEVEKHLAG